ncbi:MAG TPA: LacI family DNA-binding transcriptional regulator [Anaerolineaceae bacterium]
MSLTIDDIARISEVSRSTVSRVINADPNVKERTRNKVLEVIQSHNFQPNIAARGLAAGSTKVIGVVIPVGVSSIFSDPYFSLVIQGVSSACNHLGYSIMLWLAEPQYERKTISQILYNGFIDGVIVLAMLLDDPLIDRLSESNRPFITIGRHPTNEKIDYVDVDNRAGAYQVVSYAIRAGHHRVALIGGPANTISGQERAQGYLDALREYGLPVIPELVTEGDYSDAGGYQAMKRLLPNHPDAVFAASDAMAFAAIRVIQEAGLRIPEDIAVVGFDDIPPAATSKPPLTTVRQPIQQTGKIVAEMLIDMIEHPSSQPHRVVLPTELVIRSSC